MQDLFDFNLKSLVNILKACNSTLEPSIYMEPETWIQRWPWLFSESIHFPVNFSHQLWYPSIYKGGLGVTLCQKRANDPLHLTFSKVTLHWTPLTPQIPQSKHDQSKSKNRNTALWWSVALWFKLVSQTETSA